jgi:mannose-6-phosphate isomerase-like protein (cupin superfamily)
MTGYALPPLRRVVTANDAGGRSHIESDGEPPAVRTVEGRPGYRSMNVWRTIGGPTPVDAPDSTLEHSGVLPPEGGTVLRVIDFPPKPSDPEEARRQSTASLQALFPDAVHDQAHAKPGMHLTRTVDYAIVLKGTITAVLEDVETDLRAGDVLIQRATNHGWENRTSETARVAFVLVDGN